jgi:hypothetical protein
VAANITGVNMNDDPLKMMAVGLNLMAAGSPVGAAAAPKNLRGHPTDNEGEARLRFPD